MEIISNRIFQNQNKTLSIIGIFDPEANVFREKIVGVELPWKNNERNISCFPAGVYEIEAINRKSNGKYGIWIKNIPGRNSIVIHIANHVHELLGCIAPGILFRDIDRDGVMDVADSGEALQILKKYFPLGSTSIIRVFDTFKLEGNINPKGYDIQKHEFQIR